VLEHIEDYQGLKKELNRVADQVYIITPNQFFFGRGHGLIINGFSYQRMQYLWLIHH